MSAPSATGKLRQFELQVHHRTLQKLRESGTDPVKAILSTCSPSDAGNLAYARKFWHGVFEDFPELRQVFSGEAAKFGPYGEAVQ